MMVFFFWLFFEHEVCLGFCIMIVRLEVDSTRYYNSSGG